MAEIDEATRAEVEAQDGHDPEDVAPAFDPEGGDE